MGGGEGGGVGVGGGRHWRGGSCELRMSASVGGTKVVLVFDSILIVGGINGPLFILKEGNTRSQFASAIYLL